MFENVSKSTLCALSIFIKYILGKTVPRLAPTFLQKVSMTKLYSKPVKKMGFFVTAVYLVD